MKKKEIPLDMAQFRLSIIGDMLVQDFGRGELQRELKARAKRAYRAPGGQRSRRFHWKTLQRWYYEAKESLRNLQPASRKKGVALSLTEAQRQHLLQMRRENPSAAAELLLMCAEDAGVIGKRQVSVSTVRRLLRQEQVPRQPLHRPQRSQQRRRWEAAQVSDIWHADVCHVWVSNGLQKATKVYVHGLLDDKSRYALALQSRQRETTMDFLCVFAEALLRHPKPRLLYVDNGACYRGRDLTAVCEDLDIMLLHAAPYDPQSRGKQERFWLTMRGRCTDHLGSRGTLKEVQTALSAWLEVDYHATVHSSLKASPRSRYQQGIQALPGPLSVREIAKAFEVTRERKVKKDNTLTFQGRLYEVSGGHRVGQEVELFIDALTGDVLRAACKGQPVRIGLCDPVANAKRGRPTPVCAPQPTPSIDPIASYLQKFRKENPSDR